jgi:hypothetical protein
LVAERKLGKRGHPAHSLTWRREKEKLLP